MILAISENQPLADLIGYVASGNYLYPAIASDNGGATITTNYQTNSWPSMILIAPNRKVVEKNIWPKETLPTTLQKYLTGDLEAPKVTITSPTGTTIVKVGAKHTVIWTATDNVGVLSRLISFSSNSGATWTKVDSSAGNTGTYSWTVPNSVSKTCKIKISAYDAAKNVGNSESPLFELQTASGIINPDLAKQSIEFRQTPEAFMVYIPFSGEYEVSITDISGKKISSFTTSVNKQWYTVSNSLSSGIHVITITSAQKTVVEKFWMVR